MRLYLFLGLLLVVLVACEPEATPLPAELPSTPTPTPEPTPLPPLRYALDANTQYGVAELAALQAAAQVEQALTPLDAAQLGARFDVAAAYGEAAGWQRGDITPRVMLVINPEPPFSPEIATLILAGLDAQPIVDSLGFDGALALTPPQMSPALIREDLANRGLPDGLALVMGVAAVPGVDAVQEQLRLLNIRTRAETLTTDDIYAALSNGRIRIALVTWTTQDDAETWRELVGERYVRDLYSLPIRNIAAPDVIIDFTPGGWPLPSRG